MLQYLSISHALERLETTVLSIQKWRGLRVRHGQEIQKFGLMLVNPIDWQRQTNEITVLGIEQDFRRGLLVCQREELLTNNSPLFIQLC